MMFSVIIPLYNKESYVERAIQSVLAQTFLDFELVVVDDGSWDGSIEVAKSVVENHSNCHLYRQQNMGVSMARNNGVALSQGKYLCFLDADDWWEPTFLEEMSRLVEDFPDAGIYGTNYTIVNETKHKTRVAEIGVEEGFEKGYINYCKTYTKTMCMPLTSISVAIPRSVFDEMGGFPQGIKLGEDFLLWMRIALKHKVALLNKPLANYNQDVDAATRGVKSSGYDPDSFMTFHFNQFAEDEKVNKDVKMLLDRLRVYSLLRFRLTNTHASRVREEIAKVDFSNVDKKYRFYYKSPYPIVWMVTKVHALASWLKQKV